MTVAVEITELYIYPVKSLAGIAVDDIELTEKGLAMDRQWLVIMPNGKFVTQRQMPKMATIATRLSNEHLILSADSHADIEIPFHNRSSTRREVMIWTDQCNAIDAGEDASQWLTQVLESRHPLRLVSMEEGYKRPQSQPDLLGAQTSTLFADAAPYLIVNHDSLAALNKHLETGNRQQVDIRRFRPNLVVRGIDAFAEHDIRQFEQENGRYALRNCYPCERCTIPTVDQDTGTKDPAMEPFETLKTINPMPGNPRAPAFGENAILIHGSGQTVRRGDKLVASKQYSS